MVRPASPAPGTPAPRRDFLRLASAGALTAGMLPLLSLPKDTFAATPLNIGGPEPWFDLDPNLLYMNIGTTGSTPAHLLTAFDEYNRLVAFNPRETLGGTGPMRAAIAPGFGCVTDEIVMSYNTTDGMNKILAGLELGPGDEIITTNHEHPGGNGPMNLLQHRSGVVIKRVVLPVGNKQTAQDYVDLFAAQITPATKALVFSAPTYLTGTMLPFRRLALLAQQHGLMTVVDGAHATGMFNLDFHSTGIDFWGCSGHKWQCGPGGTGILYIRNRVSEHNPLPLFNFWPTNTNNTTLTGPRTNANAASYQIGARVQGIGNPNYPMLKVFEGCCTFWDEIGRQAIEDHDLALSAYLKQLIAAQWGVGSLYSPMGDPELVSGLTSFHPFHHISQVLSTAQATAEAQRANTFVERLRTQYGIVIRNTSVPVAGSPGNHTPMRISTHLFHGVNDVRRLVASMRELTKLMLAGR